MYGDETPKPGPFNPPESEVEVEADKDSSEAQPQEVSPATDGVQTGGLEYTQNDDGTRDYPAQQPVETVDDPTPQPEQATPETPAAE